MKRHRWVGVLGVAILAGSIGFVVLRRSNHGLPEESHQSNGATSVARSPSLQPAASVTSPAAAEKAIGFRTLPVLERSAILSDIRKRPLREIFVLWQHAGAIEKDIMKQGAIATAMAHALREQSPSPDLLDDMWHYTLDPRNSLRERGGVLGMFGGAKTVEGMEFLLKASNDLTDPHLRRIALDQIAASGDLRADGSYHEERSLPAENIWQSSADPDLLSRTAIVIAKIGSPSGINLLLKSALDDNPANSDRRRNALNGLEQVYSRNATPPAVALLTQQAGMNGASELATKMLVNIGDESAAKALISWFQEADASAAGLAANAVTGTRTPALLAAWKASLGSDKTFRSEEIRVAIRDALERYYQGISIEK
ncbi:MAG: hypothetical protein PSV13_04800 [Lacunisphaera sp.]|nr:hypothetical protein [Lacunisphaera sp.]